MLSFLNSKFNHLIYIYLFIKSTLRLQNKYKLIYCRIDYLILWLIWFRYSNLNNRTSSIFIFLLRILINTLRISFIFFCFFVFWNLKLLDIHWNAILYILRLSVIFLRIFIIRRRDNIRLAVFLLADLENSRQQNQCL